MSSIYCHPVGLCVLIDKDNAIVRIPKNASTVLSSLGKESNWLSYKPKYFHIVLRDPLDRWISGVVEYQTRERIEHHFILENLHKIEFDEHTVPQYKFLPSYGELFFYNMNNRGLDILQKN